MCGCLLSYYIDMSVLWQLLVILWSVSTAISRVMLGMSPFWMCYLLLIFDFYTIMWFKRNQSHFKKVVCTKLKVSYPCYWLQALNYPCLILSVYRSIKSLILLLVIPLVLVLYAFARNPCIGLVVKYITMNG